MEKVLSAAVLSMKGIEGHSLGKNITNNKKLDDIFSILESMLFVFICVCKISVGRTKGHRFGLVW